MHQRRNLYYIAVVFWIYQLELVSYLSWIIKFKFVFSDESDKMEEMLPKFYDFQRKADMYYAYHSIQRYTVSESIAVYKYIIWYAQYFLIDCKQII